MTADFAEWVAGLGPGIANHLWQSTAFVAGAWLLTLALKRNQARVRYAVWLTASVKFLIPFSLLIAAGNLLPHPKQAVAPVVYSAMDVVEEPFADSIPQFVAPVVHVPTLRERIESELPMMLLALWVVGAGIVVFRWARSWRVVRRTLRGAEIASEGREWEILRGVVEAGGDRIELRLSAERMEPGIFGVGRPVLVWPRELSARLDDEHIEAIMAHELAHVRRRDNLTAALHMVVETVFWFHPAAWWMERQMVKEREQACDEAVVAMGGDAEDCAGMEKPARATNYAEIYAEALLKTCRFCIESPLVCVAGVTGADLKQRVVGIVTGRALVQMSWAKKALLAAAAVCVIAAPVVLGQAKAAQRLMRAAIEAAPKPVQAVAKAMIENSSVAASAPGGDAVQSATPAPDTADADMSLGPEFEVASIRPADPNKKGGGSYVDSSGTFHGENTTLERLVNFSYTHWQDHGGEQVVTDAPEWAHTQRFDVIAKLSDAEMKDWRKLTYHQQAEFVRPILRRLLVDRFRVQLRMEQRETQVYVLTVAKGGAKLKEVGMPTQLNLSESDLKQRMQDSMAHKAAPMPESFAMSGDGWSGSAMPIGMLVTEIEANAKLDAPLINRTGLNGYYDFTMKTSSEKDAPPLVDQVEQQLGLKVEPRKLPLTYYVITAAEKPSVDGAEVAPNAQSVPLLQYIQANAKPLAFEVVSLKPSDPQGRYNVSPQVTADSVTMNATTLTSLICVAYRLGYWQLSGVEPWMQKDRFDFQAKPPQGEGIAPYNQRHSNFGIEDERLRQMMQTMLADRFHLRLRRDTTTGTVSILEQSGKPLLLVPSQMKGAKMYGESWSGDIGAVSGKGWGLYNTSMPQLAGFLSNIILHRPVIDKTGLDGSYDFHSATIVTDDDFKNDNVTSMFVPAVKEMGLKLTETNGPVEKFVIDHAEEPTAN